VPTADVSALLTLARLQLFHPPELAAHGLQDTHSLPPSYPYTSLLIDAVQHINSNLEHLLLTNVLDARYTFLAYSVVLVLVSVAVD
jgi:hypothetical protein